jgi:hypothetical protein
MLEWRPRWISLVLVLALVTIALLGGIGLDDLGYDNWEW